MDPEKGWRRHSVGPGWKLRGEKADGPIRETARSGNLGVDEKVAEGYNQDTTLKSGRFYVLHLKRVTSYVLGPFTSYVLRVLSSQVLIESLEFFF